MKTRQIKYSAITIVFVFTIFSSLAQNCTQCDNTGSPLGTYASEVGQNTTAEGNYSFAGGINSSASGGVAFAFGSSAVAGSPYSFSLGAMTTVSGSNAYALGSYCTASGTSSFVLGNGLNSSSILNNSSAYSLMIGFNSNKPTFFVSGAIGNGYTGRIGIGDVTNPQAKLHIKGDNTEDADLLLEPGINKYAKIKFGGTGTANRIEAKSTLDLNFHTASDFVFWDGNMGIGNNNPAEKLDVNGNIKTIGFILNNGQQAANKILQSDANGLASWIDPMTLTVDDGDWTINGNDVYRLNGNVGVGTTTPNYKLEVTGTIKSTGFMLTDGNEANGRILQSDANSNAAWIDMPPTGDDDWIISGTNVYRLNGNVGIGTSSPGEKLDISGSLRVFDIIKGNVAGTSPKLTLRGSDNPNSAVIEMWKGANVNQRSLKLTTYQSDGKIEFRTNNTMRLNMKGLDEMVIGTPSANYNMKVNGKIDAHEVEVHVVDWWDNVFEKDYQLRPLKEVAKFIDNNGHLPDIPSEKEVLENGIDLGEMNALLLKKVEELTLYVIELEKKISILNNRKN